MRKAMDCPLNYDSISFSTPISELSFIVFDTETTGFQVAKDDRLIEIGAVLVRGFEVVEERKFQTYVNPNRQISREITELTSISNSMVQDAPFALEAISTFFDYVEQTNSVAFVGHYVTFDMLVLQNELKREKLSYRKYRAIDTLDMIGMVAPSYDMRDLERYAMAFNTRIYPRHSAIGDAMTTAFLFTELLMRFQERGKGTWGDLSRLREQSFLT